MANKEVVKPPKDGASIWSIDVNLNVRPDPGVRGRHSERVRKFVPIVAKSLAEVGLIIEKRISVGGCDHGTYRVRQSRREAQVVPLVEGECVGALWQIESIALYEGIAAVLGLSDGIYPAVGARWGYNEVGV